MPVQKPKGEAIRQIALRQAQQRQQDAVQTRRRSTWRRMVDKNMSYTVADEFAEVELSP